jgi:hypothetical protein
MTPSPAAGTADERGPTLLTRPAAELRGEVPAAALDAFRAAGGTVHPMLLSCSDGAPDGDTLGEQPWTGRPGAAAGLRGGAAGHGIRAPTASFDPKE